MGASPVRLVVMTYDVAIKACEQRDFIRASQAVSLLRDSLNLEYGDVGMGLFRLYQWVLECIRSEAYDDALKTLRELRDGWAAVERNHTAAVPTQQAATSVLLQVA
jgi:flagellin-specific chaperone FliS